MKTYATYPGSPQLTVDALLKSPGVIARSLTSLVSKRFVADQIFARGSSEQVAGGAVNYQRSESIYPSRGAEEVGVRSEFPRSGWSEAVLQAAVKKFGLEIPISFEAIRRNQMDQIARAQRKLANALTQFVDTQAMNLILTDAAVSTTTAAATWTAGATTIISDIANARKVIADQDEGYMADTMIVNPAQELPLLTNTDIRNALPRENTSISSAVVAGRAVPLLGMDRILVTPQLTAGTVLILNAKVVGTIADEQPDAGEGYSSYDVNAGGGSAGGQVVSSGPGLNIGTNENMPSPNPNYPADFAPVYVKVYTIDGRDEKIVRCARFPAMWIAEPKAAFKLTAA